MVQPVPWPTAREVNQYLAAAGSTRTVCEGGCITSDIVNEIYCCLGVSDHAVPYEPWLPHRCRIRELLNDAT